MTDRPNIVILISDEQRWDSLGCNGNAVSHTPAIDDLAARGASFAHCQATYPLCCPSRMSIWTGLMPHDHHGFGNWRHLREDLRDEGLVTPFARAGYHTIYNGKWHVPGTTPARIGFADVTATPAVLNGLDRGRYIEEYRAYATSHGYDLIPGNIENLTPGDAAQLDRPGTAHYGTAEIPLEHFLEPWQTRRFVEQLERRPPDKPFLAVCSYNAPHFPMIVPAPYDRLVDPAAIDLPANFCAGLDGKPGEVTESAYRMPDWGEEEWRRLIAHYLGFCALIDAQVAQVTACLESAGLIDSTILVFTSDHGDMMGSHGLNKKGYPLHYEEALRVPLVIAGPGVDAGTRPEGLVSLLDLVPTLADLVGVDFDSHHQGQSHRAALEGDSGWTGRPYLLAESFRIDGTESGAGDAVSPEEFDPTRDGINLSIRTPTHRYIWRMHDRDELYDHRTDPAENTNLAHLPESAGLRRELGHLIAVSLDETFPGIAQRIREEVTTDSASTPIA